MRRVLRRVASCLGYALTAQACARLVGALLLLADGLALGRVRLADRDTVMRATLLAGLVPSVLWFATAARRAHAWSAVRAQCA